jgi:hypothetical protein
MVLKKIKGGGRGLTPAFSKSPGFEKNRGKGLKGKHRQIQISQVAGILKFFFKIRGYKREYLRKGNHLKA